MRTFGLLFAMMLLIPRSSVVRAGEVEDLRAENARLQARIAELEAELGKTRAAHGALSDAMVDRAAESVHQERSDTGTAVRTDALLVRPEQGVRTRHWLTWRAARPADRTTPPESVELVVDAAGSDGAYRTADAMTLSIDGDSSALPVTAYSTRNLGPSRGAGRRLDEKLVITVPFAMLDRLAHARSARTQLGATVFRLTPEQLATTRVFRTRLGD